MQELFRRLQREGFYFGVDTHLRVQTLLKQSGHELRQEPEKLKYLLAPLLAYSQEGQQKFYRVFDDYLAETKAEAAQLFQEGERVVDDQEAQLKVVRRNTYPVWTIPAVMGFFALLSIAVLILGGEPPHFIPNAQFHILNGHADTITASIDLDASDTISVSAYIQDSLSFHFAPGADTLGMSEVELIWLYGDGTGDTLKEQEQFFEPRKKIYSQSGTYSVQLMVRHSHEGLDTELEEEVDLFQANLNLDCPDPLIPIIEHTPDELSVGQEIKFAITLNANIDADAFEYYWEFDDEYTSASSAPSYRFQAQGEHAIDVKLIRKQSVGLSCQDTARAHLIVSVGSDEPTIELATNIFPLKKDESGLITHRLSKLTIALLAIGLTLFMLALGLLIRYLTYSRVEPEDESEFELGEDSPFTIPLPPQNHLIAPEKGIYQLASVMRQRRMGNIQHLNLPISIHATIRESGLPILHFETLSSATEYLLLIEQQHPQSHLACFFGRLTEILAGEDVLLQSFYYDSDPRVCWNDEYPEGISLEQLKQRFRKHRLIFFTSGYQLIDSYEPVLKPWFVQAFEPWRENRLILTPIPVVDWGYKEKLLMKQIDVLPLDIPGQMHMIEMFDEVGQPDFQEHKTRLLEQFPAAKNSVKQYDLETVEGLRAYLGPHLFLWLAATAVYPTPNWEVTVAMGHALSQQNSDGTDYLLTYENLLSLARIPWMQTCDLPQALRLDLLNSLDAQTERIARQTVLDLLDDVRLKPNSFAGHKMAIQEVTNQFFLTPGDEEVARKMYYLMKQQKLADHVVQQRLNQEASILGDKTGHDYLHNLFDLIRPKEYFLGSILGFLAISAISLLLYQFAGKEPRKMEFLDGVQMKGNVWVHRHLQQDSAISRHNQAVEFAAINDWENADYFMRGALDLRQSEGENYPLADSNYNKIHYHSGVVDYNERIYEGAIEKFRKVQILGDKADSVYLKALEGQALAYYHLEQLDEARNVLAEINALEDTILSKEIVKLYSMLDLAKNYDSYIAQAERFFNVEEFAESLAAANNALDLKAGDSLAIYWVRLADSALSVQKQLAMEDSVVQLIQNAEPEITYKNKRPFEGHTAEIIAIAISRDGSKILTGSRDYSARLWDREGNLLQTFEGHSWIVTAVAFSPDGKTVLTGSFDNSAILWDVGTGDALQRFQSEKQRVQDIAFSSNNRQVLITHDYGVTLFDISGKEVQKFGGYGSFLSADLSSSGNLALGGKEDGTITLWNVQNGREEQSFRIGKGAITTVTFSPTEKYIVAGGNEKNVNIWGGTGYKELIGSFSGFMDNKTIALDFSVDEKYLLVGREKQGLELWDIEAKQSVYSLSNSGLSAVALYPSGNQVAIASGTIIRIEGIKKRAIVPQKQEEVVPTPSMILVEGGVLIKEVAEALLDKVQEQKSSKIPDNTLEQVKTAFLKEFYIGKYEVTVKEYMAFAEATNRRKPKAPSWGWEDNHPIVNISWNDAKAYCEWLSEETGQTWRLPTENEWEYAAIGGSKSRKFAYAGANTPDRVSWYNANSYKQVHPVGRKQPNSLGLYDMSGNVYEWCEDWFDSDDTPKKGTTRSKVIRGGSWNGAAARGKVDQRNGQTPNSLKDYIGFRVVRE